MQDKSNLVLRSAVGTTPGHSEQQIGAMLKAVAEAANANGYDVNRLVNTYCGVGGGGCGCSTNVPSVPMLASTGGHGAPITSIPWSPKLGTCPTNLPKFLCWIYKASCSCNQMGAIGTHKLITDPASLPDPNPNIGFNIGPGQDEQLLGAQFPIEWTGETMYHGIYRVKTHFNISNLQGNLSFDAVRNGLFESLDFRVIQTGTEDDYDICISFGDAHDAQNSSLAPSLGGFYLPCGMEFVPFVWRVETQAYDFKGVAPGGAGDSYDVTATITSYFKDVCEDPAL